MSIYIPVDRFDKAVVAFGLSGLSFAPILRIERCRVRSFMRIVGMIWEDLQHTDAPSPFLNATLSGHTEEILLHLLLGALQQEVGSGGYAASLSTDAPSYVRRAKNYIDSNAHFLITMEEVADAAHVSVRTVQYGFRRFLTSTPMQYVKKRAVNERVGYSNWITRAGRSPTSHWRSGITASVNFPANTVRSLARRPRTRLRRGGASASLRLP